MSSAKHQSKKRKRSSTSKNTGQRLATLRQRYRSLWEDLSDDSDLEVTRKVSSKCRRKKPLSITLTDSESEEEIRRPSKSRRKPICLDDDPIVLPSSQKTPSKSVTCLVCSIVSKLSSVNCCAKHLGALKNSRTTTDQRLDLSDHVMIVPLNHEIIERYLDPEQIHRLRTNHVVTEKKTLPKKTTMDFDIADEADDDEPLINNRPTTSSITIEPVLSQPVPFLPELQVIDISSPESPSKLESADQHQVNTTSDPIDLSHDVPTVFTPTTARRTETEFMLAVLPKIPLKEGRFRHGKPVQTPVATTTAAANEYRPSSVPRSSPATSVDHQSSPNALIESSSKSPPYSDLSENQPQISPPFATATSRAEEISQTLAMLNESETNVVDEPVASPSTTNQERTPQQRVTQLRRNPDGSHVSISRPALPTNPQSPLLQSLRRNSTDVTPKPM